MTTSTVTSEALGDALAIRAKLMLLGWASLNEWGRAFGHKSGCLHTTVNTWGHRTDRTPHGGLSRAVMADLRATLTQGIRPSDQQQTA
jgi:hypothetical protein